VSYADFYSSFLQHPLLLWLAAIVGLAIALSRPRVSRDVRRFAVAVSVLSILDAWLSANHVLGIGRLSGPIASLLPLAFVLIGDFRFFLFVELAQPEGTLLVTRTGLLKAVLWTLLVPAVAQLLTDLSGSENPRVLFLIYEALFVALLMGFFRYYLPTSTKAHRWVRRVTGFVLLYYGLWAAADAIILATRADTGFLLRVVPNVFYYGGLAPLIVWTAPQTDPT
jgi:hypothetical protein